MFEHTYELRFSDYIDFERTKPSALLDIVQDIAILHSDSLGFGMPALRERGLIWMMQGIKMHLDHPALPRVDIKASTCPVGFKGVSSDRGTILEQNGKVFVSWFIFDLEKHTLGKILPTSHQAILSTTSATPSSATASRSCLPKCSLSIPSASPTAILM